MYTCELCNYTTTLHHDYKKHLLTQKHLKMVLCDKILKESNNTTFICNYCNKKYTSKSYFNKHESKCQVDNSDNIEIIKLKYEHQLAIEKLKNKNLELILAHKNNNTVNNNITQQNNINQNNNINLSKIQNLNLNFGDVIDINIFIENYKNQYGLTNKQTETLLENYKNGGINSCITTLVYYLKESAIQQYKHIKGKEIQRADIILPFILSDQSIRSHFEKNDNGQWDKTIVLDNIKKIVGITDDHVYKHHNTYLQLNDQHKKKLIYGVLKSSDYAKINLISKPHLYKINDETIQMNPLNLEQLQHIDDSFTE
jgi:hypothetical protein